MIAILDKFNQTSMHDPSPEIIKEYKDVPEINELDNRGKLICRPLFSHSSLPQELKLNDIWIDDFDFKSDFIYSIYVHHNQKLWIEHIDLIPQKILDGVRNGIGTLLFDNTLEGSRVDGQFFIEPFYRNITDLNLPVEKIIFVTNNLIAEQTHDYWFENQTRYSKKIKLKSFMWNVYDVQRLIRLKMLPSTVDIQEEIDYKMEHDIKHFLKINRTNRPERNLIMFFMNHHKLFDKSLVSFPALDNEGYPMEFAKYLTRENINDLKNKLPFDIDDSDRTNHGEAGFGKGFFNADLPFQPVHYKNSFVSIVMAAFPFDENTCHLHSSTFNPMYCGHPIIQFGPYRALGTMREWGFKTFGKWWDESYDIEPNHWKRLQKVMDVTLELSKLSQKEFLEIYIDMKDTLQHNVDLISNFKIELYEEFFNDQPRT